MANAKKCDRCSKFYIPLAPDFSHPHTILFHLKKCDGTTGYNGLDLCPKCKESLEEWFKGGEQE